MRGIILAGGAGSRLHPATKVVSKQLMPIYDKPMIYYPLSVLMLAGIREILIITTPHDMPFFQSLLGDGSPWGITLEYEVQPEPKGLAQALIIGEKFAQGEPVTLILGDNIFYGHGFIELIENAISLSDKGASVFGYWVKDPEAYGVVEFGENNEVLSVEEKPSKPKSHYAITGIYCYDGNAAKYAKEVKPSARGELEITSLNDIYLQKKQLRVGLIGRGIAWLDTGTHDSLREASEFVSTIQSRQGTLIASPEEVAFRNGYISAEQLEDIALSMGKNNYGSLLLEIVKEARL